MDGLPRRRILENTCIVTRDDNLTAIHRPEELLRGLRRCCESRPAQPSTLIQKQPLSLMFRFTMFVLLVPRDFQVIICMQPTSARILKSVLAKVL